MPESERPPSLAAIDREIHACRRCPIGELDNTAVMGEGARDAPLMIVGEQPGDQEDRQGHPFVGPAGRILDAYLEQAGIERSRVYVTNAVKHFKYVPRGKRRLHQKPTASEIDICRWWLESEIAVVKPKLMLALGASAARGLLGKQVSISQARGHPPSSRERERIVGDRTSFLSLAPQGSKEGRAGAAVFSRFGRTGRKAGGACLTERRRGALLRAR